MRCLVVQHGVMGACIPFAGGITLEVAFANQRLLDFLGALRLQVKTRQPLLAGCGAGPRRMCV